MALASSFSSSILAFSVNYELFKSLLMSLLMSLLSGLSSLTDGRFGVTFAGKVVGCWIWELDPLLILLSLRLEVRDRLDPILDDLFRLIKLFISLAC